MATQQQRPSREQRKLQSRRAKQRHRKPWEPNGDKAREIAIAYFLRMHGPRLANGCEEWQGPVSKDGYGFFNIGTRKYSAHRFGYQYHHRVKLRTEQHVCHACDNRKCISLEHLWIGSHQDNMRDMIAKGRAAWQKKRGVSAILAEVQELDERVSALASMPRLVKKTAPAVPAESLPA